MKQLDEVNDEKPKKRAESRNMLSPRNNSSFEVFLQEKVCAGGTQFRVEIINFLASCRNFPVSQATLLQERVSLNGCMATES